jgi:Major Facilitator Superfamily
VRDALAPLREREFRLLFGARVTSFFGNAMAPVALAFAVLDLTGSKSDLGFVLAARQGAQIAFLLVGGVWADRLPRHRVMVASNVASGASQAVLAALLLSGHGRIWELLALSAVNGTSSAFFFPASTGIVPQTVPAQLLLGANALLRLGLNGGFILGAALGGVIVGASSPGVAIAVDAGTFLVAALLTRTMRLSATLLIESRNMLAEVRDGWREFRSRAWLWAIVLQFSFIVAAENGSLGTLGPVVAKERLGGAAIWGAVIACESAGLILAGLAMLRLRPRRMLLAATLGVFAMPLIQFALAVPLSAPLICAASFAAGLGIEVFGVLWDTTMQQEIPADKLSRVSAYDALGSFILLPLGFVVVPLIAAAVGNRATFVGVGVLITVCTLAVLLVDDVRNLERRDVVSAPDAEGIAAA